MEEPKKSPSNLLVVGINIGIFALYALGGALLTGNVLNAFPIFCSHVIICFILAIALRRWVWALSAGMLLIIGFSTCVSAL